MKKRVSRMISWFFSVVLLLSSVVLADISPSITASQNDNKADILYELSPSGLHERRFMLSDGKIMISTYNEEINKYVAGEWKPINNTLTEVDGVYGNYGNEAFSFRFDSRSASDKRISINSGEHMMSWNVELSRDDAITIPMAGARKESIKTEQPDLRGLSQNDRFLYDIKASSSLVYSDAFLNETGIDVRYSVGQHKVEEDVIFNKNCEVNAVTMRINAGELKPVLDPDSGVSFKDKDENTAFNIGAPYVYDSEGAVMDNVRTSVNEKDGESVVIYSLDQSWMDDPARVYPVVFDPVVTSDTSSSNYEDTYVHTGDSAGLHKSENKIKFGYYGGIVYRGYLKIKTLPTVPSGCSVDYAELVLKLTDGTSTGSVFEVRRVASSWTENTITYANQPSLGVVSDTIPYSSGSGGDPYLAFDVSNAVDHFYDGTYSNYGFCIKYASESSPVNDYNCVYSGSYSTTSYRPVLKVVYTPQNETESNNSTSTANQIGLAEKAGIESHILGKLSSTSDVDYFKISPTRHGRVSVIINYPAGSESNQDYRYDLKIYKGSQLLEEADYYHYGDNSHKSVSFKVLKTQTLPTYYVKVSSSGSSVSSSNYEVIVFYSRYSIDCVYPLDTSISRLSSPVGYRTYDDSYHKGIDIPPKIIEEDQNDYIKSVFSGKVIGLNTTVHPEMGYYVVIESNAVDPYTGQKYIARYMHMKQPTNLQMNASVNKGTVIGIVGTTGDSDGNHLHLEINDQGATNNIKNTDVINPVDFFTNNTTVGTIVDLIGKVY